MAAGGTFHDDTHPDTSAVAEGAAFGLYPASDFRLTDGRCQDCPTIPQALWYFQRETIAVAKPLSPASSSSSSRPRPTSAGGSPDAIPPPHPNTRR